MRKSVLIGLGVAPIVVIEPLLISSCACTKRTPDEPLLTNYFKVEQYWRLNYSCSARRWAPFKFLKCPDFDGGESVNVTIASQKSTAGPGEHSIKIVQGASFVNDKDIKEGDIEYQTIYLSFDDSISDEDLEEVTFSLHFSVYKNNKMIGKQTIDNLFLESARPTLPEYFEYEDPGTKEVLKGFDESKREIINQCTMLIIPATVKKIDACAFFAWMQGPNGPNGRSLLPPNMKWILLDENWGQGECNLEEIGGHAFFDIVSCNSALYIPKTVKTIGINAFQYCTFDTQLVFGQPSALEHISSYSFMDFPNLEGALEIPEHTSEELEIGENAFCDWSKISSIKIPARTRISNGTFSGAKSVKTLNFVDWEIPTYKTENAFKNVGADITNEQKIVYVSYDSSVDEWKKYLSASGLDKDSWSFVQR